MPLIPPHVSWIVDSGEEGLTSDGRTVKIIEFKHLKDDQVLTQWAKHFREHYCLDEAIDEAREGTGLTRAEYLNSYVFPHKTTSPGPSIRSGDFAEILAADYFQFLQHWIVPRTRYSFKTIPNESTKGSDLLAFRLTPATDLIGGAYSGDDVLLCVEVKAQFSGTSATPRLQSAIDDSAKDQYRKAVSLNAMRQRLVVMDDTANIEVVKRFQNAADRPYKSRSAAAAFYCASVFNEQIIATATTAAHPESETLVLFVFKGKDMMKLVHRIYEVAADEA